MEENRYENESSYKDEVLYKRRYRPTFWGGLRALFDIESNLRYRPHAKIDHQRVAWLLVGKCMWTAMEQFEAETNIRVLENYPRPELVSHD